MPWVGTFHSICVKILRKHARAANLNCLLTLPPWPYNIKKITKKANACVDSLVTNNKDTNVIYGKPLISKNVDYFYLKAIIN